MWVYWVEVVFRCCLSNETGIVLVNLAQRLDDLDQLVIVAHHVEFLVLLRQHFVTRRKWKAWRPTEHYMWHLVILFLLSVRVCDIKHFGQNATDTPHVNSLVVLRLAQNYLGCAVPARHDLVGQWAPAPRLQLFWLLSRTRLIDALLLLEHLLTWKSLWSIGVITSMLLLGHLWCGDDLIHNAVLDLTVLRCGFAGGVGTLVVVRRSVAAWLGECAGETEVADGHGALLVYQYVGGFKISMNNVCRVKKFYATKQVV